MYMPGHAGNLIQRLFGLSPEYMPALERQTLSDLVNSWKPVDPNFDKLSTYRFSNVFPKYRNWQNFHRAFADYLNYPDYRLLNLISGLRYDFIYAIHPYEFVTKFIPVDNTEYYYVDLDPMFDSWVEQERRRLRFVWRTDEQLEFEKLKDQYSMKLISLSALLEGPQSFNDEYHRVCAEMKITPNIELATELFQDWQSVRFSQGA